MAEAPPDTLAVRSRGRTDAVDITERVRGLVERSAVENGLCQIYVPHTTAGVFINENADPDALADLLSSLDRLVPWEQAYRHAEGNAAAHIKSVLTGNSQLVPVRSRRLALGRWQGIFLVDFDGPRDREVRITVLKA